MCGICGIVNFDEKNRVQKDGLMKMRDVMVHRGPDDEGLYLGNHVGLGFRRLSIIDLAGGHQPMSNEDGNIWIIVN
jgi:asparagine synthase (glutamine-hydrolysing)